jgi:hypothetical protein
VSFKAMVPCHLMIPSHQLGGQPETESVVSCSQGQGWPFRQSSEPRPSPFQGKWLAAEGREEKKHGREWVRTEKRVWREFSLFSYW